MRMTNSKEMFVCLREKGIMKEEVDEFIAEKMESSFINKFGIFKIRHLFKKTL